MAARKKKSSTRKSPTTKRSSADRRRQQSHGVPTEKLPYRAQGQALLAARRAARLNVMAVVDHLRERGLSKGRSDGTIRTWESGRFPTPSHVLAELCRFYGTTPNDILGFTEHPPLCLFDTEVEQMLEQHHDLLDRTTRRRLFARLHFRLSPATIILPEEEIAERLGAIEERLMLL